MSKIMNSHHDRIINGRTLDFRLTDPSLGLR